MPLPQPEDFSDRIRALEQAVRDLRSSITNQSAVTEASQGWLLTDMSTPSTPSSGKTYLYSQSGRLWARSTTETVELVPQDPFPQAGSVSAPDSVQAPVMLGSVVSVAGYNTLRDDVIEVNGQLTTLIANLKGSTPPIVSPV